MSERDVGGAAAIDRSSLFAFERSDCDLPFYRGAPVAIGLAGWLIVFTALAFAFAALITMQPLFHAGFAAFIPALLFTLIPLAALALVGGLRAPRALFRPMRRPDWLLIPGFFLLNLILTFAVGLLINNFFQAEANPAGARVAEANGLDQVLFFGWTAIQLLGEEILTVLPFLAFLTLFDRQLSRKPAIIAAALVAAVIFALVHLPTYQWNLPQALIGLVPVRIVLLIPYIITRNIWVSAGTHILNDWLIFGLSIIGSGGAPD